MPAQGGFLPFHPLFRSFHGTNVVSQTSAVRRSFKFRFERFVGRGTNQSPWPHQRSKCGCAPLILFNIVPQ